MKKLYKQFSSANSGFGLIEVIVGIAMLMVTATAAVSLAKTVVLSESNNTNRVIAYNLGQQVMEEVRRSRDSAWDDFKSGTRWLIKDPSGNSTYLLDSLNNYGGGVCEKGSATAENEEIVNCTINNTKYKITKSAENVDLSTLHGTDALSPSKERNNEKISPELTKRVMVKVEWSDRGAPRNLVLVTLFTDWRPAI
jgi:type II secretory pathway pseudopilin PulG